MEVLVRTVWCARVDSNHHGENSPQGPQPDPGGADGSDGVQIVHFAGVARTRWTGLEGWMLSRCCHGSGLARPGLRCLGGDARLRLRRFCVAAEVVARF